MRKVIRTLSVHAGSADNEGLHQVQQLILLDERILLLVAAAGISLILFGTLMNYVFKRWETGRDRDGKDEDEFSVLLNLGTPKMPKSISYTRWVTKGQEPKDVLAGLNNLPPNARIVDGNGKEILKFHPHKHDGKSVFVIGDLLGGQEDVRSPARVLQYRPVQDARASAKIADGGEEVRKPAGDSAPNLKPDLTSPLTDSSNHIAPRSNPTEGDSNYADVQLQEAVRKVNEPETFELSGNVSGIAPTGSTAGAAIQEDAVVQEEAVIQEDAAIQEVNNIAPKLQEIANEINPVGMASWLMGLFQERTGVEITENDGQIMVQFLAGQFPDVVSAIEKMASVPRKFKATLATLLIAGDAGLQNGFQSKRILISIDFLLANRADDSRTKAFVDMSKAERDSPLTIGQSWHLLIDMRNKYEKVLEVIRKPPAA